MRTTTLLLILALIIGCNSKKDQYVISGSFLDDQVKEWIYLIQLTPDGFKVDSAEVVIGKFEFNGSVDITELFYLSSNADATKDVFAFFLEPCELEIVIDPSNWFEGTTVSGGSVNDEFFNMEATLNKAFSDRSFEINEKYPSSNEENRDIKNRLIKNLIDSIATIRQEYVWSNPGSPITPVFLSNFYHTLTLEELGGILNKIPDNMQQASLYKRIATYYELSIGQMDSNYNKSTKGEVAKMNDLEIDSSIIQTLANRNPNKVLYIDMWATWCGPCRQEFPHSNRLHEVVDTSKIAFIYLCAASKEENWRKMIEDENLGGQHYFLDSDLERDLFKEIGGQRYYPRYLIVNKSGELENSSAPRPSSQETKTLLEKVSNS